MAIVIHPTAVVDPTAEISDGVSIGPYAIIGEKVRIGRGTRIDHHAIIDRNVVLGADCQVFPFASIGTDPQDVTFKGEPTFVEIGDGNVVREFTTINRGTAKGGHYTRIGNGNYIMAYSHIAHDCQVGNQTIFINGATLAGHVEVEDHAVIGAFSSVHQFCRIGRNAYIGGYTVVLQDVLPFSKIAQNRDDFHFYGANAIGMMRTGLSREYINNIKEIFRLIFLSDLNTSQAVEKIKKDFAGREEAEIILAFLNKTKRGLLKNFSHLARD